MSLRNEIKTFVESQKPALMAVPTPELSQWDGKIFVRRICARAIAKTFDVDDDDRLDERAAFVVQVACDEVGAPIFLDEDILWLTTNDYLTPLVERLYFAGRWHNGLSEENRMSWRKNSKSTGEGGSLSSCAEPLTPATVST